MRRWLVLLLLLVPSVARAQSTCAFAGCTPIKNLDCSGGTTACNADTELTTTAGTYVSSVLVGGCPDGTNAVRFTYQVGYDCTIAGNCQHSLGWAYSTSGLAVPGGGTRYLRFYVRYQNIRGVSGGGNWSAKQVDAFNGGDNRSRIIIEARDNGISADTIGAKVTKGVDGAPATTAVVPAAGFTMSAWHSVQIEALFNTSAGSANGFLKIWQDTDTYASPSSASSGTFDLEVDNTANEVQMGAFAGLQLHAIDNPAPVVDYCRFQYDDQFATDFFSRMAGGGGTTYYRFRFRQE